MSACKTTTQSAGRNCKFSLPSFVAWILFVGNFIVRTDQTKFFLQLECPLFCEVELVNLVFRNISSSTLKKAKQNIEKYYAVVGVLEQLEEFLFTLEGVLPRFFSGALDLYEIQGLTFDLLKVLGLKFKESSH